MDAAAAGAEEHGEHAGHGSMDQPRRGVTRPRMQAHGDDREQMIAEHHRETLWIPWTVVLLGFWLAVSPATFSYFAGVVQPAGGREVWLSPEARATAMSVSDVASGLLLVVLGWLALSPGRPLARWGACAVGVWLQVAPVVFWSPTAVGYLNDTLVGVLVIALTVLIPGMPGMIRHMKMGGATPPGWSYNPSSWAQRWIMIATGFAGWLVSRYLAAYQLGFTPHAFDPFFGEGTRRVLESRISHAWPISDAALGSFAYTFEFLMGFMGSPARWRTMPWMVTFFGILVIPLGLVHIVLVIMQPLVVGSWCTFCLLAAAIMLPMIPLEVDEVIAMGQFLRRAVARGEGFWRTFWLGGADEEATDDTRSPELVELPARPGAVLSASIFGMSCPGTLLASLALGIAAMALPGILGTSGLRADVERLAGALVFTASGIALGEVVRVVRFVNMPLGLGIAAAGLLLPGGWAVRAVDVVVGVTILLLAWPRGPVLERYGAWQSWIR